MGGGLNHGGRHHAGPLFGKKVSVGENIGHAFFALPLLVMGVVIGPILLWLHVTDRDRRRDDMFYFGIIGTIGWAIAIPILIALS